MAEDVKIVISAVDKTKKAFGGVTNALQKIAKAAFSMKSALALAAGAGAIGFMIKQSLTAIDTLGKTASKIGTTTEALSSLQFAGTQTGVTIETVNMAAQRFTRRLAEAAKGTGEAKGALKELNIDAEELKKKSLDEQMLQLADAFGNVTTSADKVRLAMKLFDSEGVALVNTLALGRQGLKDMFIEADQLGLVMSGKAAKGVEKANDSLSKLFGLFKGLRNQITANLAPAIEALSNTIKDKFLKDIKAAGGSVEEFGLILAENILQGLADILLALGSAARGFADFANGFIEMANYVRDWMNLAPITTKMTYGFSDSIDNAAGNVWRLKMGLRGLREEADDLADGEVLPTTMQKWGASIKSAGDALPSLAEGMDAVSKNAAGSLTDALTSAISGAKSFGEAMKDMAKSVIDSLIKMMVQYWIVQPLFNAIGGALGMPTTQVTKQSAIGGSQNRGQATLVGERGPELFVPNQNGSIIPNNKMGGGGGVTVNQTINVSTGVQQTVRAEIATLMPQIANAAKGAVADARQRGGGFSKSLVGA